VEEYVSEAATEVGCEGDHTSFAQEIPGGQQTQKDLRGVKGSAAPSKPSRKKKKFRTDTPTLTLLADTMDEEKADVKN